MSEDGVVTQELSFGMLKLLLPSIKEVLVKNNEIGLYLPVTKKAIQELDFVVEDTFTVTVDLVTNTLYFD